MKKVLGIIMLIILGLVICGGLFATVLLTALSQNLSLWLSISIALSPFVITAIIMGLAFLGVNLIYSSYGKKDYPTALLDEGIEYVSTNNTANAQNNCNDDTNNFKPTCD